MADRWSGQSPQSCERRLPLRSLIACALAITIASCGRVGYEASLRADGDEDRDASAAIVAGGSFAVVLVGGSPTVVVAAGASGAGGAVSCDAPGSGSCDACGGSCSTEAPPEPQQDACDVSCVFENGLASCAGDTCELAGCEPSFANCDGDATSGCETSLSTLADCGACGTTCSFTNGVASCAGGTCQLSGCAPGFGDCDGELVNGCETPLDTLTDCGGCGQACDIPSAVTESCSGGSCTVLACTSSMADCDGDGLSCETNLASLSDCGACDAPCGDAAGRLPDATASCATQTCEIAACDAGRLDCDAVASNGCETDGTTLTNCGGCGETCTVQAGVATCATGVCARAGCNPGFADCDADSLTCETSLSTLDNCGGCNVECGGGGRLSNADATCATGACAIAQCDSGFGDCDGEPSTGCETALTTNADCGECNKSCGGSSQCVEGACKSFEFTPSNVPIDELDFSGAPTVDFNCGTTTFDSTSLVFSNACAGSQPTPSVVNQASGGEVVVLVFDGFGVSSGSTLRLTGRRPVVLAAAHDVTIAGKLDASASGTTPGAGGNQSCGSSAGATGAGHGGGGGGGFGTAGVPGTDGFGTGGIAGTTRGSELLTPLQGGCSGGGSAGATCELGGAGAGALQLTVAGALQVSGSVLANGAVGGTTCGAGGLGGGSGGGLLLEAARLTISGTLEASGGAGSPGWISGSGLGGAGGAGRIRLRGIESCSLGGSVSPLPSTGCS